ncbi:MAG: asparaginase [Magnetovibrio sp.]|nr:asparaginase [Magnetovibrio sp.]
MERKQPFVVEVTRGDLVESRHRCIAAVVDSRGAVVEGWGDLETEIYPRSAIKPLQAIPLVESGAAEAFEIGGREIAMASASHLSEPYHVDLVRHWLGRIGLAAGDLECGAHMPRHDAAAADVIRAGIAPDAAFNNCSGKHTGFLTTARHLGETPAGYSTPDHPVQRRLAAVLSEMGGAELAATARGVDGCGIPVLGMPVRAMAHALARMADPAGLAPARAAACRRIFEAMTENPEYVRGNGGFDTVAMRAGAGRFATKTGAEGVHAGIVPDLGLGIALKIEDGAARASDVAVTAILAHLGAVDEAARVALAPYFNLPIANAAGATVGHVRVADGWLD